MENNNPTIDDLLNSLRNPDKPASKELGKLTNSKDTWARIGSRDSFSELGLNPSALEEFLREWVSENEYNNI